MVVETSPGNFQVWIHSSRFMQLPEKRHWLVRMRSDPGADPKNRVAYGNNEKNGETRHIKVRQLLSIMDIF